MTNVHVDCIKPDVDTTDLDKFAFEKYNKVKPKLDIASVPQPEFACPRETYFVSVERKDGRHVILGMTVYVLRAFRDSEKLSSISKCVPSKATVGENLEMSIKMEITPMYLSVTSPNKHTKPNLPYYSQTV